MSIITTTEPYSRVTFHGMHGHIDDDAWSMWLPPMCTYTPLHSTSSPAMASKAPSPWSDLDTWHPPQLSIRARRPDPGTRRLHPSPRQPPRTACLPRMTVNKHHDVILASIARPLPCYRFRYVRVPRMMCSPLRASRVRRRGFTFFDFLQSN